MRSQFSLIVLALCLVVGGFVDATPSSAQAEPALLIGSGWIVRPSDNICGIADPRKISNPAKVDYDFLLEATPEMRELRRDRIDPDSAKGRQLRRAASELITKAAEVVRRARGHCGIWKVIRNEDGRIVPDVTAEVRAHF